MDRIQYRRDLAAHNAKVLTGIDQAEIDALAEALLAAKRVYVAGWGRAGNVIKLLSMDCSQLGLKTHIVGDNSTPSIHEGDILVIGSGSGETDTMKILAEQAKEHGAKLALISGHPESYIGKLADYNIKVARIGANTPEEKEKASIAITRSYYQVAVMLNDCIMTQMMEKLGLQFEDVMNNHNNLE